MIAFLSHFYLAKGSSDALLASFIAKTNSVSYISNCSEEFEMGVELYYKVNAFMKNHPIVKQSKLSLKPKYFKYSNYIIEIFYDHFLASEWEKFSDQRFNDFLKKCYQCLWEEEGNLPPKAKNIMMTMIDENFLSLYTTVNGIHKIMKDPELRPLRSERLFPPQESLGDLIANYNVFKEDFYTFFPELIKFVSNQKEFLVLQERKKQLYKL